MDLTTMGQSFGRGVFHYAKGRRGYSNSLLHFLHAQVPKTAKILDLGCGTGVATKQLWDLGYQSLVGCDPDLRMLAEAQEILPQIDFVSAIAEELPFENGSFDAVMVFGAFHWFCNSTAVSEIRRVLKKGGLFFCANKEDKTSFDKDYDDWLRQNVCLDVVDPKRDYKPAQKLVEGGFTILGEPKWDHEEVFTKEEALSFCQSLGSWNLLSMDDQQRLLARLEEFLKPRMENGLFVRPIEIRTVLAESRNSSDGY